VSTYQLIVPGKPMTWARAKANFRSGKPHYFTAPEREAKMGEIAMLWRTAGHPQLQGPLALTCEFIFDRPASHFRSNGRLNENHLLARPGRGKFGGDIDNLVKLVQDALNTVGYKDDSQIAELTANKRYAIGTEVTETRITIQALEGHTPVQAETLDLGLEQCEPSDGSD
jgi:Holliday junction resolvase RusA-like endonuclease